MSAPGPSTNDERGSSKAELQPESSQFLRLIEEAFNALAIPASEYQSGLNPDEYLAALSRRRGEDNPQLILSRQVFGLLGISEGDVAIPQHGIDFQCSENEAAILCDVILGSDRIDLCASLAISPPSCLQKECSTRLKRIDPNLATSHVLQQLSTQVKTATVPAASKSAVAGARNILKHHSKGITGAVVAEILKEAKAAVDIGRVDVAEIIVTSTITPVRCDVFAEGLGKEEARVLEEILLDFRQSSCSVSSPRGVLLLLMACLNEEYRSSSTELWSPCDSAGLVELLRRKPVREWVFKDHQNHHVREAIQRFTSSANIAEILDLAIRVPELASDLILQNASRLLHKRTREGAILRELVDSLAQEMISTATADAVRQQTSDLVLRLSSLEEQNAELVAQSEELQTLLQRSSDQLRASLAQNRSASEAESRLAVIETIKALVKLTIQIEMIVDVDPLPREMLIGLVEVARLTLANFGVQVVGSPGERIRPDLRLFELTGTKQSEFAVVVRPAFCDAAATEVVFSKGIATWA